MCHYGLLVPECRAMYLLLLPCHILVDQCLLKGCSGWPRTFCDLVEAGHAETFGYVGVVWGGLVEAGLFPWFNQRSC